MWSVVRSILRTLRDHPLLRWPLSHPLATAFVVALLVRVLVVWRTGPISGGDSAEYRLAADLIRSGHFEDGLARPPVYPLFLTMLGGEAAAVLGQAILGAAVAPLIGSATRRHFGRSAGSVAALLVAFQPSLVSWTNYVLSETVAIFFFAVALERSSRTLASPSLRSSVLGGLAMGLVLLTRTAFTLPALALSCAHLLCRRGRLRMASAFMAGVLLIVVLPSAAYWAVSGHPLTYRTNLWNTLANGTQWNEVGRGTIGIDIRYPPNLDSLTEEQREEYFRGQFVSFVSTSPLAYAQLSVRKALWYWLPAYPEWSSFRKIVLGTYFTALYALALLGVANVRSARFAVVLLVLIGAFQLTAMVTLVDYDARYRVPAELCLLPLAASGITFLASKRVRPAPRLRAAGSL